MVIVHDLTPNDFSIGDVIEKDMPVPFCEVLTDFVVQIFGVMDDFHLVVSFV